MSERVPCSICGTPIVKDSNGVWIDPDAPDHLAMIECPVGSAPYRPYHDVWDTNPVGKCLSCNADISEYSKEYSMCVYCTGEYKEEE